MSVPVIGAVLLMVLACVEFPKSADEPGGKAAFFSARASCRQPETFSGQRNPANSRDRTLQIRIPRPVGRPVGSGRTSRIPRPRGRPVGSYKSVGGLTRQSQRGKMQAWCEARGLPVSGPRQLIWNRIVKAKRLASQITKEDCAKF